MASDTAQGCCSTSSTKPETPALSVRRKRSESPSNEAADDSGQGDAKRLQRLRPAYTCTSCKKRKVKCDRNMPCGSCLKRGEADSCQWDDTQIQPERTQYALANDLERLQQRLEFLESALKSNPNSSAICCPASCSCHDASKSRSRGEPIAAAEDLPLSQLIDLKLGFRRDLELVSAAADEVNDVDAEEAAALQLAQPESSSIWISPSQAGSKDTAIDRLATSRYFGRDHFVAVVTSSLPQKSACDALLAAYFQDFDWYCHVVHTTSFYREYETFWSAAPEWRISSADPAWLALLLIMLAHGVRCFPAASMKDGLANYSTREVGQWPDLFWECSQLAMKQAQWARRPQIRVLQTILLYLGYLDFTNEGPDAFIWIGAAAKAAHLLGLHKLAEDQSSMPHDDRALPVPACTLKRQIAYRIWVSLLSADLMASASRQQPLSTSAREDTLKHLINCDDADLNLDSDTSGKDVEAITDVTFEAVKYRLATYHYRHSQVCREAGYSLSPFEITSFDHGLRAILEGITEPIPPIGGPPFTAFISKQIRRHCMISSAVHYRLLRLHRPYMSRGYSDTTYQNSTTACVDSALAILNAITKYWSASSVVVSPFFTLHCIEAVLVVFVDVFWRMDHCSSKTPIERNKADLSTASALFESAATSFNPQVEEIARLGKYILTKLREEESLRSLTPLSHREPLAEIFKRTASNSRMDASNSSDGSASGATPGLSQALNVNANPGLSFTGALGPTDFQMLGDVFGDFNFDWSQTNNTYWNSGS